MITAVLPFWSEKSPSVESYYRYRSRYRPRVNTGHEGPVPREQWTGKLPGVVLMFVRCQIITRLR